MDKRGQSSTKRQGKKPTNLGNDLMEMITLVTLMMTMIALLNSPSEKNHNEGKGDKDCLKFFF